MINYDYIIKQGDTAPALILQMKDVDGNPVDLTDNDPAAVQTVVFQMRPKSAQFLSYSVNAELTDLEQGIVTVEIADTDIAAGEYEAILVVNYVGVGIKESFPKFGSYSIYVDSDYTEDSTDIVYVPEFATFDDVKIITGKNVSPAILQQAEIIFEQAMNRTYEEIDEEGISATDAKWIRNGICYLAAWLSEQITPYAVSDVKSVGAGNAQIELNDTALIRSRWVVDALSKISWLQPNQTLVVDRYRGRYSTGYNDEISTWATPWKPLGS